MDNVKNNYSAQMFANNEDKDISTIHETTEEHHQGYQSG